MVWFYGVQINKIDLSFLFPNFEVFNIQAKFFNNCYLDCCNYKCFNWIDGLDGLSSGIALITTISFTLLVFQLVLVLLLFLWLL